jgi:protein involved in polysaccharide export with SLBB domain
MSRRRFPIQFSLKALLLVMFGFALGFGARNLISGLHPLAMRLAPPSSTTPIAPRDSLLVESVVASSLNRRVTVLANGTVSLPFVGTVSVSGQNIAAVEKTLTNSYSRYFSRPAIQVYRASTSEPLR